LGHLPIVRQHTSDIGKYDNRKRRDRNIRDAAVVDAVHPIVLTAGRHPMTSA
jgi:hypothetical protein